MSRALLDRVATTLNRPDVAARMRERERGRAGEGARDRETRVAPARESTRNPHPNPLPRGEGTVNRPRAAFSLIEALIALSITSLAGAVLLLSVQSSLDTTIEAVDRTIADGVAQQTIDEILTKRYVGAGDNPLTTTLGPLTSEVSSLGTSLFDDTDDYTGYVAQPLKGAYGETLGTGDDSGNLRLENFRVRSDYFQNWRVRVDVYYVDPNNHTVTSTTATNFRAIDVHVELVRPDGSAFPLSSRKRVIAYIPPPTS